MLVQEALEGPLSATLTSLGICSGDLLHLLSPELALPLQRQQGTVTEQPVIQVTSPVPAAAAPVGATGKVMDCTAAHL